MKATFNSVLSIAEFENPLQTQVVFILTDFKPNRNKQMIPVSEADNIISTARNMPIKIAFKGGKEKGHAEAYPIGTIQDVWLEDEVIKAKAIVWRKQFAKEDQYIRSGKQLHTSWEIYYEKSIAEDDVQVLQHCLVDSSVIVENPAYGGRTPIIAIASDMEEELQRKLDELNASIKKLCDTMQIATAEEDTAQQLSSVTTQFETVTNELQTARSEIETLKSELDTLKAEKAVAEEAQRKAELLTARKEQLGTVKVDDDEFIVSLTDEQFSKYVTSLKAVASHKDIEIPDVSGNSNVAVKDLANAFNSRSEKK